MCGRLALFSDPVTIARHFGLAAPPEMAPRWNVAPRQPIAAVRLAETGGAAELVALEWGFKPRWSRADQAGPRPINARAETVAELSLFRDAYRHRRCLVPADGYYEWQAQPGGKQPWFLAAADGGLLAFAGLWERWLSPEGMALESVAILTRAATAELQPIHDRMPVIVPTADHTAWLGGDRAAADELLHVAPESPLIARRISTRVNNPRHEGPELLAG